MLHKPHSSVTGSGLSYVTSSRANCDSAETLVTLKQLQFNDRSKEYYGRILI
jgi:hypothetical protein